MALEMLLFMVLLMMVLLMMGVCTSDDGTIFDNGAFDDHPP
jgi:hypothetical protein